MTRDPDDELAPKRAERDRDRRPRPADGAPESPEQTEAIERAREAWNLRRIEDE